MDNHKLWCIGEQIPRTRDSEIDVTERTIILVSVVAVIAGAVVIA